MQVQGLNRTIKKKKKKVYKLHSAQQRPRRAFYIAWSLPNSWRVEVEDIKQKHKKKRKLVVLEFHQNEGLLPSCSPFDLDIVVFPKFCGTR